jgi:hypothetical protein
MNDWSLFLAFCCKIQGTSESQTKRACFRCADDQNVAVHIVERHEDSHKIPRQSWYVPR